MEPRVTGAAREEQSFMNRGSWFLLMMPCDWFKNAAIMPKVNAEIPDSMHVQWWEFVRWMGIWFLLATTSGHSISSFWDDHGFDRHFEGAPFILNHLMTKTRFDCIANKIAFYTADKPICIDKHFPIRESQDEWNFLAFLDLLFGQVNAKMDKQVCISWICILS